MRPQTIHASRFLGPMATILACFLASGCASVESINPFFFDRDLVDSPRLDGRWASDEDLRQGEEEPEIYEVNRRAPGSYELTDSEGEFGQTPETFLHLFALDRHLFLDLSYVDDARETEEPLHLVAKLEWRPPSVRLSFLDADQLEEKLASGQVALNKYVADEDDPEELILSDSTRKLRRFLRRHGRDPKLWSEPESYTRIPDR